MPRMKKPLPTAPDDPPGPPPKASSFATNMSSLLRGTRPAPSTPRPRPTTATGPTPAPALASHIPGKIANIDEMMSIARKRSTTTSNPSLARSSSVGAAAPAPVRNGGGVREGGGGGASERERVRAPVTDRIVKALLDKLKAKLPVYSGLTLADLARDAPIAGTIQVFCNLAASSPPAPNPNISPADPSASNATMSSAGEGEGTVRRAAGAINLIALGLCELLDRVSKLAAPPNQVLHSQIFLLQTFAIVMGARTRPSPIPSSGVRKGKARGKGKGKGKERERGHNAGAGAMSSADVMADAGVGEATSASAPPPAPTNTIPSPTEPTHPTASPHARTRVPITIPNFRPSHAPSPGSATALSPASNSTTTTPASDGNPSPHPAPGTTTSPLSSRPLPVPPYLQTETASAKQNTERDTHEPPPPRPRDPAPLDASVAKYALAVLIHFVGRCSTEDVLAPAFGRRPAYAERTTHAQGEVGQGQGQVTRPRTAQGGAPSPFPTPTPTPTPTPAPAPAPNALSPSPRLTPFPRIPLHGFEEFASADVHAQSGLLSPAAVWNGDAGVVEWETRRSSGAPTPRHSPHPSLSLLHRELSTRHALHDHTPHRTYPPPETFNALHALADALPPTLTFLPPQVLLARFAARALYHLSVSNWGEVVGRVSARVGALAADEGLGGGGVVEDVTELRVLGLVAMERETLARVVQELASLYVNLKPPAQAAAAVSVRLGIFAWIEHAPHEFQTLCLTSSHSASRLSSPASAHPSYSPVSASFPSHHQSQTSLSRASTRVEGAERLFEVISALALDKTRIHGGKDADTGRALLWTALGALFCICPERVRAAEAGKKNNLLAHLSRFTHTPGARAEIAVRLYADVCRAAFFLPPECEGCALEHVARDVAEDLAVFLERHPPYSNLGAIDVDLYADALVAVYRRSPQRSQPIIRAWLEPQRSEAVKLCVVRAAMTLVVETAAFPWQPSLTPMLQASTKRLNLILRSLLRDGEEFDAPPAMLRPLSLAHPADRAVLRRTLLLSVQALLRLDIAFFLYGPSLSDLSEVNREGVHILTPPRDHGVLVMCLAMYATWIKRAGAVQKGDKLHREAVAYMNASVLTTLFACAQEVVHVWHNTENILCIHAVHHILKILGDLEENDEDTSWKFSEARLPALAMTEVALITAYKSSHMEISSTAIKSFPLLAKIASDPEAPIPSYLTRDQLQLWSPFLGAINATKLPTTGHAVMQKTVRQRLTASAFPCATHISGWRECHWRFTVLTPIVSRPEGSVEPPQGIEVGPETYKDRQVEWANHMLALAKAGGVCMGDVDPSFFRIIGTHLPERLPEHREPGKLIRTFIAQVLEMLVAETLHVRETAKQALGVELHVKAIPLLFEHLNTMIPEVLGNVVPRPERRLVLFVDQCISILKLTADRVDKDDAYFLKCDVGQLLLPIARFLDRPLMGASDLRTKAQFCNLTEKFLKRRDIFTVRRDPGIRNTLLDITMNWTSEMLSTAVSPEDQSRPDYVRAQRSCQTAALRTSCELAEDLRLEPLEGSTGKDTQNVVSRLFHRYLTLFIKALDFGRITETGSKSDSERASQSSHGSPVNLEAHVIESVISGIAHLVNANTDVGFKQCVELGYDDDPRLRAVFMKAFSRVLKHGTRFDTEDTLKLGTKQSQLCELVRGSQLLVDAVVNVCSPPEVDTMVPVLLNVLDTRRPMLGLLKRLIAREITDASSPADLFRQNNLCNRLLSAFANQQGYPYLRLILTPLVDQILDLPVGSSFELDPAKLRPGEDLETNAQLVTQLTQLFIDHITASAPKLPSVLVDICHHISFTVNSVWPDSKYSAVGGFLFLRFICPAVVAPEAVDLELPRDDPYAANRRRGLVIIAKILQNLANNILFGKEAHMVFLNPLLESNILGVSQFLREPFNHPSPEHDIDHWLGTSCDDTDTIILHHFFQVHHDEVGKILLSKTADDPQLMQAANKSTWDRLCAILVDIGTLTDPPVPTEAPMAVNFTFLNFMSQNAHRNTEPVRSMFYVCEDQRNVFVLRLQEINVELADLQLFMCHVFRTLTDYLSSPYGFKVIVDCTGFSPESELPLEWLKLCVELTPSDIRQKIRAAYILNANALAQRFLRKLIYVCSGVSFAQEVHAVASVSELFNHIPRVESIAQGSTGALENEPSQIFENIHQRHIHHTWAAVTLEVRASHLRITSRKAHGFAPNMFCKTVEIVPLDDVDDLYRVAATTDPNEFVLARNRRGIAMQFSSQRRDSIIQAIRGAKSRAELSGPQSVGRFGSLSDITATLLTIGLINTCHELEWPRGAANMLLSAVCTYLKYDAVVAILPAKSNSIILNPAGAIVLFSERMAAFAPHLTLDLLMHFRLGFNKASPFQKITCLSYLPPWIRNLTRFSDPADGLYEQSRVKIRDAVRSLIEITLRDTEVYPPVQRHIWSELAKMDESTLNIVTDELIRVAIDGGAESRRCELVTDVVMALSSIHVRSHIITRVRQALRKATLKASQMHPADPAWNELAALSRLALAASHNPRLAVQNQLLLPETAHLVTMLAANGPLSMRTSVYGMAVNVLHAILESRIEDAAVVPELRRFADEALSLTTIHWFGLSQNQSSMEYTAAKPLSEQIDSSSLEAITEMLLRALTVGARTTGLINVWRARWMSLVTATAFQEFPYMQTRAFTVLGVLVNSNVDDDFFYQIIVALKNAIYNAPEGESPAILSMLRCMRKLIPNLIDDSRYLPGIFWVSVAFLQTGHLPYYVEAMHLMQVTLEKLHAEGAFLASSLPSVLLGVRARLIRELVDFEKLSGFSFADEISFSLSLAFLVYSVTQHQTLRPIAGDVARAMLRMVAQSVQADSDRRLPTRQVDPSVVGLFLASLPFCTTLASLHDLLHDAGVDVSQWEAEGIFGGSIDGEDELAVPFSLLGASDTRSAELVISFIMAMIELHRGSVMEREILYTLMTEANDVHPSIVSKAQVHYFVFSRSDWVDDRVGYTFGGQTTTPILTGMINILNSIIAYGEQRSSPNASTSTLSTLSDSKITPHYLTLEELRMPGLLTHLHPEFERDKDGLLPTGMFDELLERVLNM